MRTSIRESAIAEIAGPGPRPVRQPESDVRRNASPLRRFMRRLGGSTSAKVGATIVLLFIVLAIAAPILTPYDPLQTAPRERLQPPSSQHWLGTDPLGRDIMSRLLEGSRVSMTVGVVVGLVALLVGVPIGVVAGYRKGRMDDLLMRSMDVLLALPGLLLAIGIVAALGPSLVNALIAIGIVSVPSFARVARASTLRTSETLYVEAARSVGCGTGRILWNHVLPNSLSAILVLFSFRVATGLLVASSLGFLGLGAQPPEPEWGAMLSNGRDYMRVAPHVTIIPGLAIMLFVLGFNLLGDGLRDAVDPRLDRR